VLNKATLYVRPAGRRDGMNAIIHLGGRKASFAAGDLVSVRLLSSCSIFSR